MDEFSDLSVFIRTLCIETNTFENRVLTSAKAREMTIIDVKITKTCPIELPVY